VNQNQTGNFLSINKEIDKCQISLIFHIKIQALMNIN